MKTIIQNSKQIVSFLSKKISKKTLSKLTIKDLVLLNTDNINRLSNELKIKYMHVLIYPKRA